MSASKKTTQRRRHVQRPDTREKLLDAAETVVREEGYAAATVRRIAKQAGMNHQAVFYYFGSQDDLLFELLARSSTRYHARLNEVLESRKPLIELWKLLRDKEGTKLGLEFMAMANHNENIRKEIARNARKFRKLEAEAIARHLESKNIKPRLSPTLVAMLTNSVARLLVQESTLGIHVGHKELERLVDKSFSDFEASGVSNIEVEPVVGRMSSA